MANLMDVAGKQRLSDYFDRIGRVLGRKARRESFALYSEEIFGDGERKSIESIVARACADPSRADAEHQRLLHSRSTPLGVITMSVWKRHGMRSTR